MKHTEDHIKQILKMYFERISSYYAYFIAKNIYQWLFPNFDFLQHFLTFEFLSSTALILFWSCLFFYQNVYCCWPAYFENWGFWNHHWYYWAYSLTTKKLYSTEPRDPKDKKMIKHGKNFGVRLRAAQGK